MAQISALLGHTDIYLLDQIMKDRYAPTDRILDAGAGGGRNLHWFVQQGFTVFGTDRDPAAIELLRAHYPEVPPDHFQLAPVEAMPFEDRAFHHVICNAVLHFADSEAHFEQMFAELVRVLMPGGSLFIRATTDAGMPDKGEPLGQGRYQLPDGSVRFLMTKALLDKLVAQHGLVFLEPFKTVLVEGVRSMSVVVLGR